MASLRLAVIVSIMALIAAPSTTRADPSLPNPVRIVVPFSPGGSNDVIARAIAPLLGKRLGVSVVVENRPGAAGVIGAESVARAARDGSALLVTSSSFLTAAAAQSKLPFDPITALAPVAMIARGPMLVAVPAAGSIGSLDELLAAARAAPGALNYGSAGVGSIAHLSTELLNADARIQTTHVPYKGASEAILGLVGNQIQLMISNYSSLVGQLKGGKLKAIAVTSAQPSPAFPDLPPIARAVPGFAVDIWVGVFAPAGLPAPLLTRLNHELNAIATAPELQALLAPDGAVAQALDAATFGETVRADFALWKRIVTERKLVTE